MEGHTCSNKDVMTEPGIIKHTIPIEKDVSYMYKIVLQLCTLRVMLYVQIKCSSQNLTSTAESVLKYGCYELSHADIS